MVYGDSTEYYRIRILDRDSYYCFDFSGQTADYISQETGVLTVAMPEILTQSEEATNTTFHNLMNFMANSPNVEGLESQIYSVKYNPANGEVKYQICTWHKVQHFFIRLWNTNKP